jgi:acylphosphatase
MKSKRVTVRIMVRGRVQGVSFRAALQERAAGSGVDGWVRNRSEGSVEALLQGDEEAVKGVAEWARRGPARAEVSAVEEEFLGLYPRQSGFRIVA